MEYKKKQRKEDIDNRGISVAKSKLVRFLIVVGIVVLVLLSSGEVFAQETSEPTWELVETLINHENRPTEFIVGVTPNYFSPRNDGSFNKYTIEETYFIHKCYWKDHVGTPSESIQVDVEMRADFTKPPEILVPGEKITLKATVSGTGTIYSGSSGIIFEYRADGINLRDTTQVRTGATAESPFRTYSISPYFVVPETHSGEISIVAFLWNAGAVNVRWVYRASGEGETLMDEESARLKEKYPELAPGYVLFAEGILNKPPLRTVLWNDKYGHSGLYIGEYHVQKGEEFEVRDEAAAPLRVFRDGKRKIYLKIGEHTKEGDVIIGAVVEARGAGIIVTTVDRMEDVAREYLGREPHFTWKTTYYPPTAEQIETIKAFALSKVKLTEEGKLDYLPGADGYGVSVENWDCVSFVEAAFDDAGFDLTPNCKDTWISIQPQEQHDYMGLDPNRFITQYWKRICIEVFSPVNLHLYDSQSRHVGITPNGAFEREIPNAYYDIELEEIPQSITVQDVDDEYTLVIEAVGDGSFDLEIGDLNVRTPGSLTKIEFQDVMITKGAMGKLNIGSADNDYLIDIDDDGDGDTDRTVEPSSLETSPITPPTNIAPLTDATAPPCTGISNYAYIESRTMENGKEVRISVMMCNANDLANMDFSVSYNPTVLRFKDVEKGSLNSNFLFESNEISSGNVKISFASSKGVSGSGSIAILTFDVTGSNGDSSILTGSVNTADTSSGSPIGITIKPGKVTVGPSAPGDCDGDGLVTSKDALAALQMAVRKINEDLCYDVTGDGKVSSDDARDILKKAVKL